MTLRVAGEGNSVLSSEVIVKEALRLLKNNTFFARVASRRYEGNFGGEVGDTVNVQLPARVKSASGRTLSVQPMVKKTVPVTVDQHEHVGIRYTVRDLTLTLDKFSDEILKSACVQLGNKIDSYVATRMAQRAFFNYGTPGTALTVNDAIYMNALAEEHGHPRDGMSYLGLSPLDGARYAIDLKGTYNEDMVKQAVRRAAVGRIDMLDVFRSSNVIKHTVGAGGGTPLVNGASQSGSSLVTDGWSNSTLVMLKGDIFTIAGVYAINPQGYTSTGMLQPFVVLSDVTSNGSGQATISISPAINSGAQTQLDGSGNATSTAAYQSVNALPADNAAITIKGTANTTYRQGIMFHRDACVLAVPPLAKPRTATVAETATDPETGLSIALTGGFDITGHQEVYRLDVIWGAENVYPELTWRAWSAAA